MPPEEPFKWRQETAVAISKTAFGKMALEYGSKFRVTQIGSSAYGALETDDGFDFYYTADAWLYQARRVNTQTAANGALATRIQVASGQVSNLVTMYAQGPASAGATLVGYIYDEDGALNAAIAVVAAGANRSFHLPTTGVAATTNANNMTTEGLILGPGEILRVNASEALINETLTIGIVMLLSTPDIPVWDTTGSAGTPSLAASTISVANTLQAVLLP